MLCSALLTSRSRAVPVGSVAPERDERLPAGVQLVASGHRLARAAPRKCSPLGHCPLHSTTRSTIRALHFSSFEASRSLAS